MKFYDPKYKQLDLGLLRSSLDELDKTNRWVALGELLPWTELEKEYNSRLDNQKKGAGNKPARMILGAMIIKHKLNLSDAETIEIIRESPYMQYFCGLHEFTEKPIFDPSLFVTIRKRISEEELNKMTVKLLNRQKRLLEEKRRREEEEAKKNDEEPPTPEPEDPDATSFTDSQGREHKGVLKMDATCADAEMRYPVDVDIIHDGCRKVTDYIIKVCETFELHKPRTNFSHARQVYLQLVKKAKKKGKMVRDAISVMLNCLRKDIRILMDILAKNKMYYECLFTYEKRTLTAIFKMYRQQEEMFRTKTHTCADRILSIFQPHVRAIVRGKAKARTEFGAKIGASVVEGYTFIDHHSWDAYNESQDLSLQIQLFKERFGKPLGRPPKDPPSEEMKSKMAKAVGGRNEIECSFGTGKRIYRANDIRAKLPETARCWTGMCYFVKNVMKFLRELCLALTELWRIIIAIVTMRGYVCYPLPVTK